MLLALNAQLIEFIIPGKAVAWQRPVTFMGKDGLRHMHTADESRAYQNLVALACRDAMNGQALIELPVALEVQVTLAIPASKSQKWQAEARHGERMPTTRPDIDNILKSVKDGLTGVAWRDDAQVCRETISKQYGLAPQVEVRIETMMAKGHK
jgi:Holliday junction resolvase RusA-like endonuclease